MRILFLTPTLPYPLHQGGAIRNYGLIRSLHEAGHEVTLMSFHDNSVSVESTPLQHLCAQIQIVDAPLRTSARRLIRLMVSSKPDLAQRFESPCFSTQLESLLRQQSFDLVQFEGLEMAVYLPLVRRMQPDAKLCYDAHNAEYVLQQEILTTERKDIRRIPAALYSALQTRRIAQFERDICQHSDLVIAVSEEDSAMLQKLAQNSRIHVVQNGIFADEYTDSSEKLNLGKCDLIFTGKMDYRPNIDAMLWFSNDILPTVRRQFPETQLYIIGQKPHARLQQLRDRDGIKITGWVPNIQPYLRAGAIYVAPLRMGSGTRLKILEAMAAGCAIISTSAAASGLHVHNGIPIAIADTKEAFAQQIINLLQNPDQQLELGRIAESFVREHYNWPVLMPRLLAAYSDIGLE